MTGLWVILALLYATGSSGGEGSAPRRTNVLLITVDTCRPDHLGTYGYGRDTSPALDALAANGVVFDQAISSSSWTTPGLLSVLTGLWAPSHGVDVRGKSLRPGTPTLASALSNAGYATPDILYLSTLPNFQNLALTDSYADRDRYLPEGDAVLFRALEAYQDSTFFLYYHYRNLHLPFNPSPPYDRMYTPDNFERAGMVADKVAVIRRDVTIPVGSIRLGPEDREWIHGLYDGQVREMDDSLFRPLVDHLKKLDLFDNTLVIVSADHGEELLDHGFVGHPSTSFKGSAYDELLRIPLIMVHPGLLPPGRRVSQQVQNVDILPTVLDLLGLPPEPSAQGRSLRSLIEGGETEERTAFTETTPGGYQATPGMLRTRIRAVRTSRWKLIHTLGPGVDRYALHDLEADPAETRDLSSAHPDVTRDLRAQLHRWVLDARPSPVSTETPSGKRSPLPDGPVQVLYPADGDRIRYEDVGKVVSVRWTGPSDRAYTIDYRVGEGVYRIEGEMQVQGSSAQYGPYTEEMWNMLGLYNPWSIRVRVDEAPELSSQWTTFRIVSTAGGAPGAFTRAVAFGAFLWSETALLAWGLVLSVGQLLQLLSAVPVVWIISAALILSIAGGIFQSQLKRLGGIRLRRWGVALGYTGVIYLTLPTMPVIWSTVWRLTQGRIDYMSAVVMVLITAGLLAYLIIWCRRVVPFLLIPVVVGSYLYLLWQLPLTPAERFHFTEYGALSWLVFRALRVDMGRVPAYLSGVLIAGFLGIGDETIQWLLPVRVFEWKDIGLNVFSSAMGMILVALMVHARPDRRG